MTKRVIKKKTQTSEEMPTISVSSSNTTSRPMKVTNIVAEEEAPKKAPESSRTISALVLERDSLKANMKIMEGRLEKINNELKISTSSSGVRDSNGSFNYILNIDGKERLLCLQARKSVSLDKEKAETLFKKIGVWDKVTETVTIIKESAVEGLVSDGKISMKDLESVTNVKITQAFVIDPSKKDPK